MAKFLKEVVYVRAKRLRVLWMWEKNVYLMIIKKFNVINVVNTLIGFDFTQYKKRRHFEFDCEFAHLSVLPEEETSRNTWRWKHRSSNTEEYDVEVKWKRRLL